MHRSLILLGMALAQALAAPTSAADQAAPHASRSIAEALDQAWMRAPAAAALPHRRAEADAQARAAAGWTPGPTTVGVANRNDRLNTRDGRQEWEFEVATPLWLPGQRDAQQAQARARLAAVGAAAALQRLDLAGQVREAWWQLAGMSDAVAVAARRLQSARALQADVERRWRAGELARTDANGARAEAHAAEAEWLQAQAEQRRAVAAWRTLTGTSPPAVFADEAIAPGQGTPDAHPRLAAADAAVNAARTHLRVADRSQREAPELALRWVRERGAGAEPYASTLGIQLRFPLSSGPRTAAELSGVRAELSEAEAQQLLLREQLEVDAQAARLELESIETTLALAQARAALATDTLQLLQKSFSLGQTDLATLLRTRAEAHEAEAALARRTRARSAAISRLNQALGVMP